MFDKVLIRGSNTRLTEHDGTRPRAGGGGWLDKSNRQDTKFNTKSITYSQSTSKIMVRSRWTVFKILLMSAWDFMEECLTISLSTEWLKMF